MRVHPFEPAYLPGLRTLINLHLSAVVPGWSLPDAAIATHLEHNYGEYVTDPWVIERTTLLATEGWRVLAAVHLLRYGDSEEVGEHFRRAGEFGWLLSVPERSEAAAVVLSEAREQLSSWWSCPVMMDKFALGDSFFSYSNLLVVHRAEIPKGRVPPS